MSIYISPYQVCRNIYYNTKYVDKDINILTYVWCVDKNINIPSMSIYISAYQVYRNIYQHTKYVDIDINK